MPRPRGGDWLEDELKSLKEDGVGVVVSLLESDEADELGLGQESSLCRGLGLEYASFPIADRNVPSSQQRTREMLSMIENWLAEGQGVVIHCRQGIGRSSLLAAGVLAGEGDSAEEAFARIARVRGYAVPDTQQQRDWVRAFVENSLLEELWKR